MNWSLIRNEDFQLRIADRSLLPIRSTQAVSVMSGTRWFTPDFRQAGGDAIAPIRAGLLATDPRGYAGCCAAIRDMDMRRLAGLNHVPTLVIAGASDAATPPEDGRTLCDAMPQARLVLLEAAHLSNVEQPAAFARAVTDFLLG